MNAPDSISRRSNLDAALLARTAPLPIASYFDRAWFEREMLLLFNRGPNYVGSRMMVPELGDYRRCRGPTTARCWCTGRAASTCCRTPAATARACCSTAAATITNIVCPLHRWTYDLDGKLLGAPDFDETPECSLPRTPLKEWHGLLFAGPRDPVADLADFPLAADYDYSNYVFDKVIVDECPFNWKTFLEIFLELYHVEAMHPGLQKWVDAGNYEWGFGDRWSYQILGIKDGLQSQVSPNYQRYRDTILAYSGGALPKYGTVWSILYPNVMLEWYPYALVVSTLIPRSPDHTTNIVEFYYPEEVQAFERQIVEAHQAAYAESAAEDAEICAPPASWTSRIVAGRRGRRGSVSHAARGRHDPPARLDPPRNEATPHGVSAGCLRLRASSDYRLGSTCRLAARGACSHCASIASMLPACSSNHSRIAASSRAAGSRSPAA